MGKYEDLLARLRDEGLDDLAEEFESFSATSLRKKAAAFDEVVEERDQLKVKVQDLIELPKKEQAFKNAGVDFEALRPAERKLIRELKPEGEVTEEWVAQVIAENELPTTESGGTTSEEAPAAAGVAAAATSAPVGNTSAATVTAETVKDWPADRWLRWSQEHPEAADALKRGETVKGIVV